MKKQSVLVKRALLCTAIVLFAAVAVGLPVSLTLSRALGLKNARAVLSAQMDVLSQTSDAPELPAQMLNCEGGIVWTRSYDEIRAVTAYVGPVPSVVEEMLASAGEKRVEVHSVNGKTCAVASLEVSGTAIAAALPVRAGNASVCAVAGIAAGAIAAAIVAVLLKRTLLIPAVKPIAKLRDVAVSVAAGHLDVRADEKTEGEIGELAKAINNVSTQLAMNMYSLILERNRLRHMLDGLSEGIVAIDNEGHVTHTNPSLEKMFTRQKLALHLPDPRMKWIPDKSVWEDFDSVIRTGEPLTRNLEVRDMTLKLTVTPIIDEIGITAGAVGLFSDITSMERLERTRREYVSNVSHELRTPLTAVRALVEPLKDGMVTSEADRMRYYDIILREVMRLSRLINDQLELSRLQSGTLSIQKSRMTLDDLVYDTCDRYTGIAKEHGLALNVLTDFSDCPPVRANADRVEQMLIILLDNAIKYTEQGSVSVSATWDDERVVLSVRDTGVGIAEEDLPYVFDRFYKVDKAHSGKGSGLGLSIANELLKRMNEQIWVTSEKGRGSEFSFTIQTEAAAQRAEQ